jgi:hypothetical protein
MEKPSYRVPGTCYFAQNGTAFRYCTKIFQNSTVSKVPCVGIVAINNLTRFSHGRRRILRRAVYAINLKVSATIASTEIDWLVPRSCVNS